MTTIYGNNEKELPPSPARLALLAATVDVAIGRAIVRLDDGTACEMDAAEAGAVGEWGIMTYAGREYGRVHTGE